MTCFRHVHYYQNGSHWYYYTHENGHIECVVNGLLNYSEPDMIYERKKRLKRILNDK
jgi:hypothetical protein